MVVVDAVLAGLLEALGAGPADAGPASFVFVIQGHVADADVEPNAGVVISDSGELGGEHDRVLMWSRCG
jgi:hypothetical protein